MSTPLPDPHSAPELFKGVLTRRVFAYVIDVFIMMAIATVLTIIGAIAGVLTFGLGAAAMIVVIPLSIVGYYAITLGSPSRATIGMRMMDIVLTPTRGEPLDGWRAFAHPFVFWLTCVVIMWLNLLFALFTPRRQMIHDLVTGTLMVRRSPMERHWQEVERRAYS